ncbi:uncharacterized protein JCM6883_000382 [Sporobolomyces salmoneus]|uniref:uncharacterized protein n=1 Tax=Sporobolomyces salmoneus TaxID=183962 RepID=UPI00317B64E9
MPTQRPEPLLVQIPPSTSPLLLPTDTSSRQSHSHRYSNSSDSFTLNHRNPDIPDDLEFVAPGQWDESIQQFREEEYDDDEHNGLLLDDDEDADIEDWTLEEGHIEGVPCANVRMNAKLYQSTDFLQQLFNVLRHDLAIPGWSHLPIDTPPTLIQVHKVSGSLTNAVFFVSIPETPIELDSIEPLDFNGSNESEEEQTAPSGTGTPKVNTPPFSPLSPATVFSELEKGRQSASTPTPRDPSSSEEAHSTPNAKARNLPLVDESSAPPQHDRDSSNASSSTQTETILFSAPTLLLRIYGPSSGSLISRRNELHILHTLSSQYGIGPRVLGTFANGRVEEYFHSRALVKEEMRDPRISRWIGRRMRELHSVDLEKMIRPPNEEEQRKDQEKLRDQNKVDPSNSLEEDQHEGGVGIERPALERNFSSGASAYSISSNSSLFSFGTSSSSSCYSYSSNADSVASNSTVGSPSIYGTPRSVVASSPSLLPQRPALESRASSKKRPRRKMGSSRSVHKREQTKLCVWENITRWTREAKLVLNELDQLASIPGFNGLLDKPVGSRRGSVAPPSRSNSSSSTTSTNGTDSPSTHIPPLASPSRTLNLRAALNLPLFEQQLRLYRSFVHSRERTSGRSKRVFAHNDTQYGNLLLLTPDKGGAEEEELEKRVKREGGNQKRIIVVDFEYAGANPRGFDIANHFCEWQADYHHESLSHSLSAHQPYPTLSERIRFLRSYVGCDGGFDQSTEEPSTISAGGREDPRVEKLMDEVKVWEPSSHAMWAVWGIVQAKEDLLARIQGWKEKAANRSASNRSRSTSPEGVVGEAMNAQELAKELQELKMEQQESHDEEEEEEWEEVEAEVFDYLSYAAERMEMFRKELAALGVI